MKTPRSRQVQERSAKLPVPISRFQTLFRRARRSEPLPEALALATADRRGRPSVRFVLLKEVGASGFVFYTNVVSRKASELRANPRASMAFYWHSLGMQVRVDGRVVAVTAAEADEYWATRPRESQLAALASRQSAVLHERAVLLRRWRALQREYRGREIPRPPGWTGFRLIPDSIEFWTRREPRLHDRELFVRRGPRWVKRLLQP